MSHAEEAFPLEFLVDLIANLAGALTSAVLDSPSLAVSFSVCLVTIW